MSSGNLLAGYNSAANAETRERVEALEERFDLLMQQVREAAEYLRAGEIDAAKSVLVGASEIAEGMEK